MRPRIESCWPLDVAQFALGAPAPSLSLSRTDYRIRRVLEVMGREYSSHLTVNRLAEVAGLSRSRFEHLFKAETGRRFSPALRQIRLSKARMLLAKSNLSVKEIACRVGFLSTPAFSRAFK